MYDNKIMHKTGNSNKQIQDILGLNQPTPRNDIPYRGVMVYDHKTAGCIQVMDASTYSNWKGYQPGRYGRSATKKARGKNTCHI